MKLSRRQFLALGSMVAPTILSKRLPVKREEKAMQGNVSFPITFPLVFSKRDKRFKKWWMPAIFKDAS